MRHDVDSRNMMASMPIKWQQLIGLYDNKLIKSNQCHGAYIIICCNVRIAFLEAKYIGYSVMLHLSVVARILLSTILQQYLGPALFAYDRDVMIHAYSEG